MLGEGEGWSSAMPRRHSLAATRRGVDPTRRAHARGKLFLPSFSRRWGLAPERHSREAWRLLHTLYRAFEDRPDIRVGGSFRIYYDVAHPRRWIEPDVFVAVGASKRSDGGIYRLWEAKPAPDFVIEVAYDETHYEDQIRKPAVYAQLGVRELIYYDPEGDYLVPALQAYILDNGRYRPMEPLWGNTFESRVLGLRLSLVDARLQLFDHASGERLVRFAGDGE
jgi:Uma2 family endonuclease